MAQPSLLASLFRTIHALGLALAAGAAGATPVQWTDWTSADTSAGFTGHGSIQTTTSTVDVTYTNTKGVYFYQTGASADTDYWVPRTPSMPSPYTSPQVDNRPTGSDIIALMYAGNQTLSFSQAIANPVLAFVSLNGNGYSFLNQDFEILSTGCGIWGCGTATKEVVDLGNGNIEYRLIGNGELHGAIRFTGAFDTLTWTSMSAETWNGFTVGVQGTKEEVIPVPAPWLLLAAGAAAMTAVRRRKTAR